jgi:hypothetical protein
LLPLRSTGLISQFLDHLQSVGLLGREISSSQGLYLYTGQHKHRKTHTHQTSIPWVGFEPTIPASERAKTVHALDSSATVIGISWYSAFPFDVICQLKFHRLKEWLR